MSREGFLVAVIAALDPSVVSRSSYHSPQIFPPVLLHLAHIFTPSPPAPLPRAGEGSFNLGDVYKDMG